MIFPAPPPALAVPAVTVDTATLMRAELRARLEKRLVEIEADLAKPTPTVSVRNLPNGALTALVLNKEPARAEALLRRLFALQDRQTDSPTFGEVPWQMNRPEIDDKNANWTDIAANYFADRRSYAGPHSRDYDFVGGGGGGTGYYLALAGLPEDGKSNMLDFEKVYPLVNTAPGGYVPDPKILALARAPARIVRSR